MLKPTKILVPTDFSAHADKALKQAIDIARQYGSKVYLLHVVNEEIHQCVVDYCLSEEQVRGVKDQVTSEARSGLEKQLAKFPEASEVEVISDVKLGVPYEAILKEEEERGIDLIVIGSLGRTAIAKFLIGSVARNVLKGAKCSVLLTK